MQRATRFQAQRPTSYCCIPCSNASSNTTSMVYSRSNRPPFAALKSNSSTNIALMPDLCVVARGTRHLSRKRVLQSSVRISQAQRSGCAVACVAQRVNAASLDNASGLLTMDVVQQVARSRGLSLYVRTFGPFWRILCREGESEEGPILGVVTGWCLPFTRILHCETLQVFTRGMKGPKGERVRGGALGLGLILGGATFSFGLSRGCQKAEILAINDDDTMHARLVRYYSYFGFKPVRVVEGASLRDLPDMLVWGGVGTRMDADIRSMLQKWGPSFRSRLGDQSEPETSGVVVEQRLQALELDS